MHAALSLDLRSPSLAPRHRGAVVGGITLLHGALAWALMQGGDLRLSLPPPSPLMVKLVSAVPAPRQVEPPPPIPLRLPVPEVQIPPPPMVQVAVEPMTVRIEVARTESAPAAAPAPVVAVASPAPASPARLLPASAVQYLQPPVLVYPRASRRAGEAGRVIVRVFIDEAGQPRQVQVSQSSGHARLDEAAIAAVQKARFKPALENGQPLSGWALIPLTFDLEN